MVAVLVIERDIEFPAVIVWDALTDSDLLSGWLGEARVEAVEGGAFTVRYLHRPGMPTEQGVIATLIAHERLEVDTDAPSRLRFDLVEVPAGSRGRSTTLSFRIEVDTEPAFTGRIRADWLTNLDQLEDLLRGHPVNWSQWERDRGADWVAHLGVENSSA